MQDRKINKRNTAIIQRILEGYTLDAVGNEFGISGERVRQILKREGIKSSAHARVFAWRPTKTTTFVERFWRLVNRVENENACWVYTGLLNRKTGYGVFTIPTKNRENVAKRHNYAHRLAFILHYRQSPKYWVSHLCYNKLCCNPRHLSDMPIADIMQRREKKNRRNKTPLLAFSANDVQQIVDMWNGGVSQSSIARQLNTNQSVISLLVRGKTKAYRPFLHQVTAAPCEQVPRNVMAANVSLRNANNLQPQN